MFIQVSLWLYPCFTFAETPKDYTVKQNSIINLFAGAVAWVALMVYAGFYFGNIEVVKNNFSIVALVIIFISILPGIIEYIRHKRNGVKV